MHGGTQEMQEGAAEKIKPKEDEPGEILNFHQVFARV